MVFGPEGSAGWENLMQMDGVKDGKDGLLYVRKLENAPYRIIFAKGKGTEFSFFHLLQCHRATGQTPALPHSRTPGHSWCNSLSDGLPKNTAFWTARYHSGYPPTALYKKQNFPVCQRTAPLPKTSRWRLFFNTGQNPGFNYFVREPLINAEVVRLLNSYNFKRDGFERICLYNGYHDFVYTATAPTTEIAPYVSSPASSTMPSSHWTNSCTST